ncbi:Glycosyltransferase, GT2 family [Prauserella aidingensis]|uniref:glycosyltransferase family 2 protein n=1 Tax=Prauserella aidingensis TaxID=387890 RepID=UPI0020A5D61D|nr:glycosyltransferase [Prauserella aidingensis]MCP2254138.1 Glycosyltransferase, GT2 family [Prauserella aidingensis]
MRTTVVIATRNRCDSLLRTLRRLRGLDPRPAVVVVDNASSDDTVRRVRDTHPEVDVLSLSHNEGAVARNHGVRQARTPYVAFSDDDSWWEPGALPRAERVLDAYPDVGLLAARPLVGATREPDPVAGLMAHSPLDGAGDLPGPRVLGFLACAAVVRRDAFLGVGGFHPLLWFAAEEKLLAYDLAAAGWSLAHAPDVLARHDPAAHAPDHGRRTLEQRNTLLIAWLRRDPAHAARATAATARRALSDPAARDGLRGAVSRLPAAVRERRRLPGSVEKDIRLLEKGHGH